MHYFHRRRRPNGNFSLEFIFDDVRRRLRHEVDAHTIVAPWHSNGVVKRVGILAHAAARQGQVNHVTGDITFVALGLRKENTLVTVLDCGAVLQSTGLKRMILQKLWLELPIARSSYITTISNQAKSEIVELARCDADKIFVVPVAISESFRFSPRPFESRSPRVLAIGTAANKNLLRLIEAIEGVECTLVVIGHLEPAHHEALQRHRIAYENHCNLSQAAVVEQYDRCDLLAFASSYEGFGMPILEAQAVGRPVITSALSSMPEVAGAGACLVDPLDVASIRAGVRRVIDDASYRSHLIERGRENAKRFDADKIARQYLELYERIAAHRRS